MIFNFTDFRQFTNYRNLLLVRNKKITCISRENITRILFTVHEQKDTSNNLPSCHVKDSFDTAFPSA